MSITQLVYNVCHSLLGYSIYSLQYIVCHTRATLVGLDTFLFSFFFLKKKASKLNLINHQISYLTDFLFSVKSLQTCIIYSFFSGINVSNLDPPAVRIHHVSNVTLVYRRLSREGYFDGGSRCQVAI